MAAASRLGQQLAQLLAVLEETGASYALIGGLALSPHGVVRGTADVDLLLEATDGDMIDAALVKLGYHCQHRSNDAGNYVRGDQRVDLLYAYRPIARRLVATAAERLTPFGRLRVVSAEGLIGLKLQALANNPRRTQDLEDIRALLRANRGHLDLGEMRLYFRLFDREPMLDDLLNELRDGT
ncbi:MAG: nucleotidyl transferase AbiEii/AbiGii toxin family protein [Gammaproteobacteria bacterium]|nr:nucleotidyl transferase AbiEii/AbiGii toxin family protein [Gammaproteobacteria bacterium]